MLPPSSSPGHARIKFKAPLAWLCFFALSLVIARAQTPLFVSEILFNPPGAADSPNEYIELRGIPNATIPEGTYFLAVEGDAGTNAGTIQNIFDLSGRVLGGNGYLVLLQKGHTYVPNAAATVVTNSDSGPGWGSGPTSSIRHRGEEDQTELENASVTFLLIQTASPPAIGDDLDLDDDGTFDNPIASGWVLLDSVGVLDADGEGERAYGQINFRRKTSPGDQAIASMGTIVPVGFTPGYVARNGKSTGWLTNDWVASDGLTGKPPTWLLGFATNAVPTNRARAALNHVGGPNFGAAAIPGVTLLQSRGATEVSEAGTNDTYTLNLNTTPRGRVTIQVAASSQLQISTDGGITFASTRTLAFTNTAARTIRVRAVKNDFVESTRPGTITNTIVLSADAQNYPLNTLIPTLHVTILDDDPLLLNEVKVNPPGTTNDAPFEYVEIKGKPGAKLTNVFLLSVQGKAGDDPGTAETVVDLTGAAIGTNGLLMIAAVNHNYVFAPDTAVLFAPQLDVPGGAFGNNTLSILLVTSPEPIRQGDDLDAGDNGTLEDLPKGTRQLDAVGWTDGGVHDVVYGGVVLMLASGTPDAAARFPGNSKANSVAAWYCGRLAGEDDASLKFDKDHVSTNFPTGTVLTPGFTNNTAPTITAFAPFSSVIGDLTNPTLPFTVHDVETTAAKLIATARSDQEAVVANSNLVVTAGAGGARTLKINPNGIGYAKITVTVSDGVMTGETTFRYAASAMGRTNTHFHTGISDASTALRLDANWMLIADDENQTVRLYSRKLSGPPTKGWDFNTNLGLTDFYTDGTPREVDLEASTRVGNRIYWLGSHSHAYNAEERENRGRLFATDLSGTGTNISLRYVGRYDHLKPDLINWDTNNLHGKGAGHYGFANSTAQGVDPKDTNGAGFNIEGLCMAPGSATTAYLALRAPLVLPANRVKALIVPVTNFTRLAIGNGGPGSAQFGPPIELNLGGRGIRSIEGATNNYLIVAGPPGLASGIPPSDFRLFTWNGRANNAPQLRAADLSGMLPEGIVELPNGPWTTNTQVQLISDNGITVYYGDTNQAKQLKVPNFKKFRTDWVKLGPVVTPAPILKSIVLSGTNMVVTWYSVAGKKYQLQCTDDVNSTDWTAVAGEVMATDAVTSTIASPSAPSHQFYRVVLLP